MIYLFPIKEMREYVGWCEQLWNLIDISLQELKKNYRTNSIREK
jgi:hypothetical protein